MAGDDAIAAGTGTGAERADKADAIRSFVTNPGVGGLRRDPDGNLIPAIWPAILDPGTWRAVRAALSQPVTLTRSDGVFYRTTRERRPSRRHLLSAGLAFCGVCGAPISAQVRKRPSGHLFVVYTCNPRLGKACVGIVGHHLERRVVEVLLAGLADPTVRERLGRQDPIASGLAEELDAIDLDLAGLAGRWGRGEISRGEWDEAREGLAARGQALRNRLGVLSIPAFDPATVPERWIDMGLAGRRAILAAVFERIEVHRATVRHYDPDRIGVIWRVYAADDEVQTEGPSIPRETDDHEA